MVPLFAGDFCQMPESTDKCVRESKKEMLENRGKPWKTVGKSRKKLRKDAKPMEKQRNMKTYACGGLLGIIYCWSCWLNLEIIVGHCWYVGHSGEMWWSLGGSVEII